MIVRMVAVSAAAFFIAACSSNTKTQPADQPGPIDQPGPSEPTLPNLTGALHSAWVVTPEGSSSPMARFPTTCNGPKCSAELSMPNPPGPPVTISFSMNCEGPSCSFAGLTPVPSLIDSSNGFNARATGADTAMTELGEITLRPGRGGVTVALNPTQKSPLGTIGSFSGWGDWGAFAAAHVQTPLHNTHMPVSLSVGQVAGTDPVAGTATWSGVMAAHTYTGVRVNGAADMSVDFAAMDLDVSFTGMTDGEDVSYADLTWENLAIENGGFARKSSPGDSIEGRFYGPNHEEGGGIFERAGMIGGFHAIRGGM